MPNLSPTLQSGREEMGSSVFPSTSRSFESYHDSGSGFNPPMQVPAPSAGVSNCYVFKSRLQEYAQKVGISTPTYETIREGPSHDADFRSTVIVGGNRYDSLTGFRNRKAAEQSAAEIALKDLSSFGEKRETISMPVHETGLCKNLLQEYAQKMNYAIPNYICQKDDRSCRTGVYTCTVEIGGIQYIGAAARTKKEAEIKAARTALLAIQMSGDVEDQFDGKSIYTVVPSKRKVPDTAPYQGETASPKKPKKPRIRNKTQKDMNSGPDDVSNSVNNNTATPVADQNSHEDFTNVQEATPVADQNSHENFTDVQEATPVVDQNSHEDFTGVQVATPVADQNSQEDFTGVQVATPVADQNSHEDFTGVEVATPIGDQNSHEDFSNVQVADSRQSPHCLESVSHVTGCADVLELNGEPSTGKGDAVPIVVVCADACQLTNHQQGDVKTDLGASVESLTDADSYNGSASIMPMINAAISTQWDAVLSDYGADQGREVPVMTDTNNADPENQDHGVGNITPMMNTQASEHLDTVNSDSKIGPGEPAHDVTDSEVLLSGIGQAEQPEL